MSTMLDIYAHQTAFPELIISELLLSPPGDKHRQISNAPHQHRIQQMNLLKRFVEEMADDGINRNREAHVERQYEKCSYSLI